VPQKNIILGVAPVKRIFLDMAEAKRQKDKIMAVIRSVYPGLVKIVDIDDLCENGIGCTADLIPRAINKFIDARINALFIPFCDFGEESVAAGIAAAFKSLPVLIYGPRDERPNCGDFRGRDTQCGMFAATKVISRSGVTFSYIFNETPESESFKRGYTNFLRVAAVLKDLKGLRIAKIGDRPGPFLSVQANEGNLVTRFGISVIPVAPVDVVAMAKKMLAPPDDTEPPGANPYTSPVLTARLIRDGRQELRKNYESLKSRMNTEKMTDDSLWMIAALKTAIKNYLIIHDCSVGAFECWTAFSALAGVVPCISLGDLTDEGLPLSCECDINGAITMAILRAADLYESSCFLADLTIRNPQNDNSELLWHCGPFPFSLKAPESSAALDMGQGQYELKQGNLTLARFDDINGTYVLFTGEGKTSTGPRSGGTYVWLEVDNWKRWEEKLIFGPYIHHIGGIYGSYLPVLREVARYLGIAFDNAHEQGIYSL
jgi:L-fucose isomerase-like protein